MGLAGLQNLLLFFLVFQAQVSIDGRESFGIGMAVQDIASPRLQGYFKFGGFSVGAGRGLQESHAVFEDRIHDRSLHGYSLHEDFGFGPADG